MPDEKTDKLKEIEARLKELGIDEDTVLSAGGPVAQQLQRWYQCEICRSYIDTFLPAGEYGPSQVVPIERIRCPKCGSTNFATVEGDYFHPRHEKLKGQRIPPLDPKMARCIREGQSVIEDLGLFPADEMYDNEPVWPRHLAAALIGVGIRLTGALYARRPHGEKKGPHPQRRSNPDVGPKPSQQGNR